MPHAPRKNHIAPAVGKCRGSHWVWVCLLLITIFVIVVRVRLLEIPLERDEGEYAYAGQLMLQGIPPYQLVYNIKLPGTYAAYALLMAVFGQTTAGVHLGLLVINLAATLLLFFFVRKLIDDLAGIVASATFAMMSIGPAMLGFAGHATHFVVIAALGGFYLLRCGMDSEKFGKVFWSGFLFGTAFLCKQPGIFLAMAGGLWLICQNTAIPRTTLLKKIAVFSAGIIAPYAMTCLILWRAGVFEKFWRWTITYASGHSVPLKDGLKGLAYYFENIAGADNVFWGLTFIGLLFLPWATTISVRKRLFMAGLLFFSFLAICPGFYFSEHYFILMLPAIGLLIGAGISAARARLAVMKQGRFLSALPVGVFVAAVGWVIVAECFYLFRLPPVEISSSIYEMNPFVEAMQIADYIRDHSSPDARVAVLGSEPEIYFYARRRSATGYIYGYDLMLQRNYAIDMQREMIHEIETVRPEFIVLVNNIRSWTVWPKSDKIIFKWGNAYTGKFYNLVGIVDQIEPIVTESGETRPGETIYKWDSDTEKYPIRSSYFILVYKKKPNAG